MIAQVRSEHDVRVAGNASLKLQRKRVTDPMLAPPLITTGVFTIFYILGFLGLPARGENS